ncbi:MAG: hypothetical protein U1D06_13675 [Paracoccaceae bacterium]|nr:hypothetical protein [Paracoccaceae bacterium]
MMRAIVAVLIWLCAGLVPAAVPTAAPAGAWPRGEGNVFIAMSADQTRAQIYAEYGLRGDWTLGLEATMPQGRRLPDLTSFVHHPIWRGKGGGILSAGLAYEQREAVWAGVVPELDGVPELAVRAGLFWGLGFDSRWGAGWMAIDAQAERIMTDTAPYDLGRNAAKLDATIGIKPMERLMVYLQAQGSRRQGDPTYLRLEPSVAWAVGAGNLVLSPSVGVVGPKDPRLKMGVWLSF